MGVNKGKKGEREKEERKWGRQMNGRKGLRESAVVSVWWGGGARAMLSDD